MPTIITAPAQIGIEKLPRPMTGRHTIRLIFIPHHKIRGDFHRIKIPSSTKPLSTPHHPPTVRGSSDGTHQGGTSTATQQAGATTGVRRPVHAAGQFIMATLLDTAHTWVLHNSLVSAITTLSLVVTRADALLVVCITRCQKTGRTCWSSGNGRFL